MTTLELLTSDDPGYEEGRRVHNGLVDKRPGAIAPCRTTADVVEAVRVARRDFDELSVRGGGHNVGGRAVTDGGLMIDLSPMRDIAVDPDARTVRVGGGVLWGELNDAAAAHGLATTGGVVSSTGVAGLTLGGGIGWLMGRHGLCVDNLISVELVTAEGEVLHVSDDEHADLFWGLRGAGANFGVATAFEFRLHPLVDVLGGLLVHPFDAAAAAADQYRRVTKGAPDDLRADFGLVHAPDGSKAAGTPVCHCGDPDTAEREVAALRELPLAADEVRRIRYPVMNTVIDGMFPRGALNYWKSAFLTELSDAAVQTMIEAFGASPSTMSAIVAEHFHGAATRVDVSATAVPHRVPGYNLLVLAQWSDPADTQANIAWARETFDAMRPFLTDRRYSNYQSADDAGFAREAYGPNYDRLVDLKRRYDPGNLFRLNLNVDPS